MKDEVYLAVQTALLSSGCSPQEAVRAALEAVVGFAITETEMTKSDLARLIDEVEE